MADAVAACWIAGLSGAIDLISKTVKRKYLKKVSACVGVRAREMIIVKGDREFTARSSLLSAQ